MPPTCDARSQWRLAPIYRRDIATFLPRPQVERSMRRLSRAFNATLAEEARRERGGSLPRWRFGSLKFNALLNYYSPRYDHQRDGFIRAKAIIRRRKELFRMGHAAVWRGHRLASRAYGCCEHLKAAAKRLDGELIFPHRPPEDVIEIALARSEEGVTFADIRCVKFLLFIALNRLTATTALALLQLLRHLHSTAVDAVDELWIDDHARHRHYNDNSDSDDGRPAAHQNGRDPTSSELNAAVLLAASSSPLVIYAGSLKRAFPPTGRGLMLAGCLRARRQIFRVDGEAQLEALLELMRDWRPETGRRVEFRLDRMGDGVVDRLVYHFKHIAEEGKSHAHLFSGRVELSFSIYSRLPDWPRCLPAKEHCLVEDDSADVNDETSGDPQEDDRNTSYYAHTERFVGPERRELEVGVALVEGQFGRYTTARSYIVKELRFDFHRARHG